MSHVSLISSRQNNKIHKIMFGSETYFGFFLFADRAEKRKACRICWHLSANCLHLVFPQLFHSIGENIFSVQLLLLWTRWSAIYYLILARLIQLLNSKKLSWAIESLSLIFEFKIKYLSRFESIVSFPAWISFRWPRNVDWNINFETMRSNAHCDRIATRNCSQIQCSMLPKCFVRDGIDFDLPKKRRFANTICERL